MNQLMQKFCCEADSDRPQLEKPFNFMGFTYATNGRIIIRVPSIQGDGVPPTIASPAQKIFDTKFKGEEWTDIPEIESVKCEECDGAGTVDHEECGSCYDGFKIAATQIGHRYFANHYLRLMKTLTEIKISPGSGAIDDPMPFKFEMDADTVRGEGLLMPCRKEINK